MIRVLVTDSRCFLGRNLLAHLGERRDCDTFAADGETFPAEDSNGNWPSRMWYFI